MYTIKVKQTSEQRFSQFNFHRDETIVAIQAWIQSGYHKPLLLEGCPGVGRKFAVSAAAHLMQSNHKVISLNTEILDQPLESIEQILTTKNSLNERQVELWNEIKQYAKDTQTQNDSGTLGWAIIGHLGIAINLGELVLDYFKSINKETLQLSPEDQIADLLRALCQKHSLILHLDNAESSPKVTETLLGICKRHNIGVNDRNQLNHCLLAINCSDNQSFSNNFLLNSDGSKISFTLPSFSDLKIVLPTRNIHLSDSVLKLLMSHGDHEQRYIYPKQLNSLLLLLKKNQLLTSKNDRYYIADEVSDAEILSVIGSPLTNHYESQLKKIEDQKLRSLVNDYLSLAALCGSNFIPKIPCLYLIGLDYHQNKEDSELGDLVLNTIDSTFLNASPALIEEYYGVIQDFDDTPLDCYQLSHPIIQDYLTHRWTNEEKVQYAEQLLQTISALLPHQNNSNSALLWHLALTVGGEVQERWFESLYFHAMGENVDDYKALIKKRIKDGTTNAKSILDHAIKQAHYPAFLQYLQVTVEACWNYLEPTAAMAASIHDVGVVFRKRSEYQMAVDCFEYELAVHRILGNKGEEARSLNSMGVALRHIDVHQSLEHYKQSLTIFQEIGDQISEGNTLNNIANIYIHWGDQEMALEYINPALEIFQRLGEKPGECYALHNMSLILSERGDYETALSHLERVLTIREDIDDKMGQGSTLFAISGIHHSLGNFDYAINYLEQALTIKQEVGDRLGISQTLNGIGVILCKRGDYEGGVNYLTQALSIEQEIGDVDAVGHSLNDLATVLFEFGDDETAYSYLKQAIDIHRETGNKHQEGSALLNIAAVYLRQADCETALDYLRQSLILRQEIGDKSGEGLTLNAIGQTYAELGNFEVSLDYLKRSRTIQESIGDRYNLCITLFNIGNIYYYGKYDEKDKAFSAWISAYKLSKDVEQFQTLALLEELAPNVGLTGGLAGWENLAK